MGCRAVGLARHLLVCCASRFWFCCWLAGCVARWFLVGFWWFLVFVCRRGGLRIVLVPCLFWLWSGILEVIRSALWCYGFVAGRTRV